MIARLIMLVAMFAATAAAAQAAPFMVTSPAFQDGGSAPVDSARPDCGGGKALSPPLAWTNAPATTKSFAILAYDPDSMGNIGVSHWVAYGIPASVTSIPAGFGSQPGTYVGGKNTQGTLLFLGFCPPAGENPHHYTFTVYATSLEPNFLPAGLDRNELIGALKGHGVAAQSIVGKYGR